MHKYRNTTLFQCLIFYRTGREFTVAQQYGGVALLAFPLFWLAGAGSVIFWVIGASLVAVLAHAGLLFRIFSLHHPREDGQLGSSQHHERLDECLSSEWHRLYRFFPGCALN